MAEHDCRMTADADRILRSSVPDRWKGCASPIGAVQSYIAELEEALIARGVDPGDLLDGEIPSPATGTPPEPR